MKTLLVIFGITGDLSTRKLLPALSHIVNEHKAGDLQLLGISRRDADIPQLVTDITHNDDLARITHGFTMDVASLGDYSKLKQEIQQYDADQVLVYLSVPPGAAAQIVDLMGEASINTPDIKLLFEKPFGFDLTSAKDFIERTARYFQEDQLFRIDHYMAKEVSSELLKLRRNAENHHHHWGVESVESVTIVASEEIGIEGRAQFYEQTGALRDFVQGHLMQLLSLVLMTKPTNDETIPAQRLKALQLVREAEPVNAIRGQYKGYQAEAENPGSTVETLVALELRSDDPNWKDVSIRLISGKALSEKRSYIEVRYKDGTVDTFEEGSVPVAEGVRRLDAYERVILEAISGDKALFTSSEEVIRSWEILASVQQTWSMESDDLLIYPVGLNLNNMLHLV